MIETENKRLKKEVDKEYTRQYTLNPEAVEKLIADKMRRAEILYKQNQSFNQRLGWLNAD